MLNEDHEKDTKLKMIDKILISTKSDKEDRSIKASIIVGRK